MDIIITLILQKIYDKIIIVKVLRILKWTKIAPMPVGAIFYSLININYLLILLIIQSKIQAPTTDTKIL